METSAGIPPKMPPFSMLRAKRGPKSRPRTPPSPGSFYSPAVRSPAPWATHNQQQRTAPLVQTRSHTPAQASARAPPSAWGTRPSIETHALQLDLGPSFDAEEGTRPTHTRQASDAPIPPPKTDLPGPKSVRPTPAPSVSAPAVAIAVAETQRRVPTPIKIPRMHVHAPSVTIERTAAPSPSPPAPLTSNLPAAQTPTTASSILPSPDASASIISESAPELVTILRAERASAAVYGIGFGLTLRAPPPLELARQDSATLPREGPYSSRLSVVNPFGTTSGAGPSGLSPIPASCAGSSAGPSSEGGPSPVPALTASASASPSASSKGKSPLLRRSMSTDEGLAKARPETIYARPGTETYTLYVPPEDMIGIVEADTQGQPLGRVQTKETEPSSPVRVRSKTLTERGPRQRSATVDVSPRAAAHTIPHASGSGSVSGSGVTHMGAGQVHHALSYSNLGSIRRARSPSAATTATQPSRPVTPPDSFPAELVGLVGKGIGAGMSTQAQIAGLAFQSGSLGLSFADPLLPANDSSPRVRTMRLQSAPTVSNPPPTTQAPAPPPPSKLSKFARSQFDGFSFLGTRGRSVSETSSAGWAPVQQRERGWTVGAPLSPIAGDGESSPGPPSGGSGVPVRPARPPSLTLKLDPPSSSPLASGSNVGDEQPRPALGRGNSGSSTGSHGLVRVGSRRLRRKRSSPRQGGSKTLVSDGVLERSTSTSVAGGSHARSPSNSTGNNQQQPTPTSSNNSPLTSAGLALKQRRETVFPSTPRSFSNESVLGGGGGGSVTAESPLGRSAAPDFPGFVLDGSLLMPQKSPAPSMARKAHLPIGPRLTAPAAPAVAGTGVSIPVGPTPGPSKPTTARTSQPKPKPEQPQPQPQPPSPRLQPKAPPSPAFEPIPVRWRGLTMDAAKWTFSSDQLQSIVSRAIRQSAETSSVRLLSLDVLDQELPTEVERLEQLRDVLQTKYKAQVRRRRLLMRSLALYIDGHDPPTSRRLMDELEDVGNVCDQLAEDLYLVGDQLAQISRLRDVHSTSALAVALRKINGSFIRARSEVVELQAEKDALEAERDQAWMLAESLERELAEARQGEQSESSSRVSAARKSSVRQSKLSLRPSVRRSARSSVSGGSMRYHGIVFPRPPSTHAPATVADSANTSVEFVPPVPPVPTPSKRLSTFEPSRPESISVLPASSYAQSLSPGPVGAGGGNGESFSVLSVPTPSATSHDLYTAQSELLKMLGLSYTEYGFRIRPRSYSDGGSPVSSPPGSPSLPPSAYGPRGKLLRSTSDQALRRYSTGADRMIAVRVPATGGVPEDPAAILAALTLPQD